MKSSKRNRNNSKTAKIGSEIKKSISTEGFNVKNSVKLGKGKTEKTKNSEKLQCEEANINRDLAEIALGEELETAFDKFWKTVTDGLDKHPHESVPRSTPVNNKIMELQKRIRINQAILKNASDRMKGITFAAERESLSQFKEGKAFRNPSREELNRFKDVKALDLEIDKLRAEKPDHYVFLKSSPGIVSFHETMENTLNMLDKIQKSDELGDLAYRDVKSEFNLDFIKAPNLVAVSDEE